MQNRKTSFTPVPPPGDGDCDGPAWDIIVGAGPVLVTAIHAGHHIRADLADQIALSAQDRLREEDPMTDYFLGLGDSIVRANRSRFEVDLNRPADRAVYIEPEDSWGMKVWKTRPSDDAVARSRAIHAAFYDEMARLVEAMIAAHGRILVIDVHSYNHRRDGADAPAADRAGNPNIDVGATTLNRAIYGDLLERFVANLDRAPFKGGHSDARVNVRWPDGGNFPEWLHARYGAAACVMTLEYKKVFMDEWTGEADIIALQQLRHGLGLALADARSDLAAMAQVTA